MYHPRIQYVRDRTEAACILSHREIRKYGINECSDDLQPAHQDTFELAYVRARSSSRLTILWFILCQVYVHVYSPKRLCLVFLSGNRSWTRVRNSWNNSLVAKMNAASVHGDRRTTCTRDEVENDSAAQAIRHGVVIKNHRPGRLDLLRSSVKSWMTWRCSARATSFTTWRSSVGLSSKGCEAEHSGGRTSGDILQAVTLSR